MFDSSRIHVGMLKQRCEKSISEGPTMKTKAMVFSLIIIFLICLPTTVWAWDDCPRGDSCTYPGQCSRYIDTNQDGICDHGQEEPVVNTSTQTSGAEVATDSYTRQHRRGNIQSDSESQSSATFDSAQITTFVGSSALGQHNNTQIYHLSQILTGLTLLYFVTYLLSRKGVIRVVTHRKLWNMALLFSFLISAVLGVILVIEINFGLDIWLPFDTLFWHVETGIAMGIIGIFHVIWHWAYFKKMVISIKQAL